MIGFDEDAAGAILMFAAIHNSGNRALAHRQSWERANLKAPPPGTFGVPTQVWLGPAITRAGLEHALSVGRNPKVVRRSLTRAFIALEREHLLEPYAGDENPHTLYRTITELGQELVEEDAHREFLHGLPFVASRWEKSVVCIFGKAGIGTGFFVSPRSIVTARHVLEGLEKYTITDRNNREIQVESVHFPESEDIDLALITLKTECKDIAPIRIARDCDPLDEVVVFGYPPVPLADDAYLLVNRGEISAVVKLRTGIQAVLITCLLKGGYSGGPVLNRRGQVVGVVSKNLFEKVSPEEQSINEALGFAAAVPFDWVSDLIEGKT